MPRPEERVAINPAEYRQLLGRFATGVTVITTLDGRRQPAGMTASALSAASLEPPLLLVCVSRTTDFQDVLRAADRFAVNVLASDQDELSRRFATDGIERFAGVRYTAGPAGVPLLEGVTAHIFCERGAIQEAGDHSLFLGRVIGGQVFDRAPLLHYGGHYTTTRDGPPP